MHFTLFCQKSNSALFYLILSEDYDRRILMSNYFFITNKVDLTTSAIELAQMKRMKIFDKIGAKSTIVEIAESFLHPYVEQKYDLEGRIINMYDYFQKLNQHPESAEKALISRIFNGKVYHSKKDDYGDLCYFAEDNSIKIYMFRKRVYYVDYFDNSNRVYRREFYKCGVLSSAEVFNQFGKTILKQYYDTNATPVLEFYYYSASASDRSLSQIVLHRRLSSDAEILQSFDSLRKFTAYFLDQLSVASQDSNIFLIDRSTPCLDALNCIESKKSKFYLVFHSKFENNGKLRGAYATVPNLLKSGILSGVISATSGEAVEFSSLLKLSSELSLNIPVGYSNLPKHVDYSLRDKNKIILVSRISQEKRVGDAIQAVIEAKKNNPDIYLDIWGYSNDEEENNKVRSLVQVNKAGDYIHFKGYKKDLSEEYDSASIQLQTSKYEGFGLAMLEGQSHGLPVISYDVKYGPQELITDDYSGFLVTSGDTHKLAHAIDYLLHNREAASSMSQEAYENSKKYSFENVTNLWKNFVQKK